MQPRLLTTAAVAAASIVTARAGMAGVVTVDFETDDNGLLLGNGQIIDDEFFSRFTITSPETGISHLGPTIFDSTPGGPNAFGHDKDLLVDLRNVLILQNTAFSKSDGLARQQSQQRQWQALASPWVLAERRS